VNGCIKRGIGPEEKIVWAKNWDIWITTREKQNAPFKRPQACSNREPIGDGLCRCRICGDVAPATHFKPCGIQAPSGPGTELAKLIAALGLKPKRGCSCKSIELEMNLAGPAGCRQRRGELLAKLRANFDDNYSALDIVRGLATARKADAVKLLWKIRAARPHKAIERLFDLAVEAVA
jgi:hypothetical protein